jgi:hypothetical protein
MIMATIRQRINIGKGDREKEDDKDEVYLFTKLCMSGIGDLF